MNNQNLKIGDFVLLNKTKKTIGQIQFISNNYEDEITIQVFCCLEDYTLKIPFIFPKEIIQTNLVKTIKKEKINQKIKVLYLSNYLKEVYNFEEKKLNVEKIESEDIHLVRFFLKGKRSFFNLGKQENFCKYCEDPLDIKDLYRCNCQQLYHKTCFDYNKKCLNCEKDIFIDLKKSLVTKEFDFSGFETFKYDTNKKHKKKTNSNKKPNPVVKEKPVNLVEENKIYKRLMQLYSRKSKKKLNRSETTREKIKEIFFKILTKSLISAMIEEEENIISQKILEKFTKMTTERKYNYIKGYCTKIEQTLYRENNQIVRKNSIYLEKAKILSISLKKTRKDIINLIFEEKITPKDFCKMDESDLMDKNLKNKIEEKKRDFWSERKVITEPDQLIKSKADIVLTEVKDIPTALDTYRDKDLNENEELSKNLISEEKNEDRNVNFKNTLFMKIKELLVKDTADYLLKELGKIYN